LQVSTRDQSPHRILNKHKKSGLMSELKMSGHNTHECHTMLLLFLAIAIRAINHPYLKMVITRMCHSFTKRYCQQNLLHQILPSAAIMCQWAHMPTCTHVCQRICIANERRTGWSRKLLDIFDRVILLWVYKMVDVKYSRRGGTKV
jgi:hypothetical protein